LKYNSYSLIFLEGYIERTKVNIEKANWSGLINACGAFFGACIIENYGGIWNKNDNENVGISCNNKNRAFPFAKVSKPFGTDLETLYALFIIAFQKYLELNKRKEEVEFLKKTERRNDLPIPYMIYCWF
jgi:hypothetical protein